ncbi:Na+/H+ antiporter NhaC family protein [Atopobacter sp. AH10]|uniref:Na+/H+ antiporter NhaC family protein n=1 Tax=Atopobacter sp. AH10 TaxID=2315861 RepID=UPI000EF26DCF|nr:Na+/H+ antiporter NhaC family protein [Atopobacter sp. AH10]RLK63265.1 Na+/H+ antiporter NhaC family protein [Atopobacter sp. AH10]
MTTNRNLVGALILGLVAIGGSYAVAASGIPTHATFWALVPPIVAISLALITKEVYPSLFTGILVGAILASKGSLAKTMDHVVNDGLIKAVSGTAGIFLFLVLLGMLVALINKSGGTNAFGEWASKHIKSRRGAQFATFLLGILIFIDDYFNCLTVGSVMQPITSRFNISRAKLAYIIDATAAPICMIAPISSWAAAVSGYAEGTGMSGITMFVKAIPYNYYSLLTLVFVIVLIWRRDDFGSMLSYEEKAIQGEDRSALVEEVEIQKGVDAAHVLDLVLPILVLIVNSVLALIYVGGFFNPKSEFVGNFVGAFGNTDATVALPWGAMITLLFTISYLLIRRVLNFDEAMNCLTQGFNAMVSAMIILTMATSLKNISNELLGSAEFVGHVMSGVAGNLQLFLPVCIFVVACLLAFATGTSWGTFGILIPIVCSMFTVEEPLFFISLSACLAGAVCGDHCSPISDTTIMSSAGAACKHVVHVSTQLPYALTVALVSGMCYIIAGFVQNPYIPLLAGILMIVGILTFLKVKAGEDPVRAKL